jgi:hypothetical protein
MSNDCVNNITVTGPAPEIQRFKAECIEEKEGKHYWKWPWTRRTTDIIITEVNPEELQLLFGSDNNPVSFDDLAELFSKLSFVHKYREPMNNFHGFDHWDEGVRIATGREQGDEQWSSPTWDYMRLPRGTYVPQGELAEIFGKSFAKMEEFLIDSGLKYNREICNQKAIDEGYAEFSDTSDGLPMLWNAEKISRLIDKGEAA